MTVLHSPVRALATLALTLTASTQSMAQETLDLGVLKDEDISVIQKKLYELEGRAEIGYHAGWMPFDAFTTTPVGAVSYTKHREDGKALEVSIGGGYGLKNAAFRELESEAYGVAPDAYRYLGSALVDMQWAPVYAKMGWGSHRILHHDVYGLAGGGITAEQAILPDHTLAVSPTLALGVGA
ncbi:MAG: hypothetical protein QGG40_05885, partial [Myxococcota bacterium]|nr:hypothetical protein [Myxococcota bacterium]